MESQSELLSHAAAKCASHVFGVTEPGDKGAALCDLSEK